VEQLAIAEPERAGDAREEQAMTVREIRVEGP
jgi:hypothetical protein